jgi:Ser/Thr protein kinase RdoA (MazF antagonist)
LEAELYFARAAHEAGLPVVAPADEVANAPILTPDGPVTFWPLLQPEASGELDWGWLGRTLSRLHQLSVPPGLPSLWDPLKRVEQRIAAYAAQSSARSDYISVLSGVCMEARKELLQIHSARGVSLVHGDATPSNVIQTKQGPLLIDFDLAGVGPPEWDLMAAVVSHRRFGLALEYVHCFLEAYGCDPGESESFRILRKVRELLDTSFALTLSGIDIRAERELDVRMRAWLTPDDRSGWTPLGTTLISVLKSWTWVSTLYVEDLA